MKYKAIISDLDGTLLNSNHQLSDYTKDTIRQIIDKGIKFIIATGRHYIDASCFMDQLNSKSYLISSNGANAHDSDRNLIFNHKLNDETIKNVLALDFHPEMSVNIFTKDGWYVEKYLPEFAEFHKESGFLPKVTDFKTFKDDNVLKFCFICNDTSKVNKLEEEIKINEVFKDKINLTSSLDICLEIMEKNVSKGETLKEILAQEKITLEETIAFGDGLNDIEMLSLVGKGLVMGNASDRLKESLPHNEVIDVCDNDAVANYLASIFLKD